MRFTWLVALLGLSVLVVPLGGLVLLGFLVFGRSWITTSAYGWYTIWTSPDEAAPGGERFVWSRTDGSSCCSLRSCTRTTTRASTPANTSTCSSTR